MSGIQTEISAQRGKTRQEILEAAKELVARKGPHATTIRDITTASGANVAAVNYYFRSKEDLVRLAAYEISGEVNRERIAQLDAFEAEAGGMPLAPRDILRALIEPILVASRAKDGGSLYLRSVFQMRTLPNAGSNRQNFGNHHHVARRFVSTIQTAFPHLSHEECVWHYEMARGTALHMLANLDPVWRRFELILNEDGEPFPEEPAYKLDQASVDRVIAMILQGFGKSQASS